ncbi:hypothetical protein HHI36_003390 [Cryptolaemus montrouzieri]|uniref:Uncharacterized protein n=1 Tax=Cryptolaemus montrouzieri TaxID=559131 RepID=A0ABD2PD91_9CUCU
MMEMGEKLDRCMEKFNEQTVMLQKNIENMECMRLEVKNVRNGKNKNNIKSNRGVLMVKPSEEENVSSKITHETIINTIDPGKLEVGIDQFKNVTNGAVVIRCNNEKSKNILKKSVLKEFGNGYTIEEPQPRKPKILVKGFEDLVMNKNYEKIIAAIVKQNELMNEPEKFKIVRRFSTKRKRNYGNIVIEVEKDIYKAMKKL